MLTKYIQKLFIFIYILSFLVTSNVFAQSSEIPFTDHEDHQFQEAIEYLYEEGIISGYPDSTFKPDIQISRAELLKIIVASNFDETDYRRFASDSCFPDVGANQWFTQYICFAQSQNIIEGYPDGTFQPGQNVNLIEALKMMYEGMNILVAYDAVFKFKYYSPAMRAGYIPEELTGGYDEQITRAQTSEIIYQILIDPDKVFETDFTLGLATFRQDFLASCGIAALSIGLSIGQDVSEQSIVDKMVSLNMYPNNEIELIDGKYIWDDPQEVFVGDMNGIVSINLNRIRGFGFMEKPMELLAQEWAPNSFKFNSEDIGFYLEQLLEGNPIIAFANVNARDGYVILTEPSPYTSSWQTHSDRTVYAPMYKHNIVIEGFKGSETSPTLFYVVDPYYGQKMTLTRAELESILEGYDYSGVVIKY